MEYILPALQIVCTPHGIAVIFLGALFGILCGAMPGLSSIMAMTILMPFTFSLDGLYGILMLLGVFCGSVYGGSITAILINTPGTANAAATCLDGYPMAQRGQPDRAISISTSASCFGGLFGSFCLLFTAPLLASVSIKFGVAEYFALGIFGLSIVTGVSSKSMIKGVMGAILGLLMGTVGIDTLSATFRYTFNVTYLVAGIAFVPLLIGLYALAQCFTTSEGNLEEMTRSRKVKLKQILPSLHDIKRCTPVVVGCSILGTIIGAIPGTGGDIASWVGYNEAKRWVKKNEVPFGEGTPEGIAAPESANNAIVGGALIPLPHTGNSRRRRYSSAIGRAHAARYYAWSPFVHQSGGEGLYHHYRSVFCEHRIRYPRFLRNPDFCKDRQPSPEMAHSPDFYLLHRGHVCPQQQLR